MGADNRREQLELLQSCPLADIDWLCILIDGGFLTRELCVVVAVEIDAQVRKQVLDFEQEPSEKITAVATLIRQLADCGVNHVGCWSCATAAPSLHPPSAGSGRMLFSRNVSFTPNLREKLRKRDRADLDVRFKAY